jgi:hypothetical protein
VENNISLFGDLDPPDVEDMNLNLNVGDELIERIAERAAALVAGRQEETARDGWLRGADKIAAYIDSPGHASMDLSRRSEFRSITTAPRWSLGALSWMPGCSTGAVGGHDQSNY